MNKDTVCNYLDVRNICFLYFIIDCEDTLKKKIQSSSNKSCLLNTEKLVTGYIDHFCTLLREVENVACLLVVNIATKCKQFDNFCLAEQSTKSAMPALDKFDS